MFQSFIEFAARHADRSVPALVERLKAEPISWAGRLSAAALAEMLEYQGADFLHTQRSSALAALTRAVAKATRSDPDLARESLPHSPPGVGMRPSRKRRTWWRRGYALRRQAPTRGSKP